MKELKVLALSSPETETYYQRLAVALSTINFELICLTELPETISMLQEEKFNLALVDSNSVNLDDICFKIFWLCRIPLAVVTSEPTGDLSALQNIGISNYIPRTSGDDKIIALIQNLGYKGRLHLPRIKILVIEDEAYIRDAVKISLRIYWPEAEVLLAAAGQEGLNLVNQKQPDLIILDLGLPDISGFEVLNHVRAYSRIPVIILTALSDKERVVQAIHSGANDYIVKPFKQKEFVPRIKRVVDKFTDMKKQPAH